jgi:hypothetical protein
VIIIEVKWIPMMQCDRTDYPISSSQTVPTHEHLSGGGFVENLRTTS